MGRHTGLPLRSFLKLIRAFPQKLIMKAVFALLLSTLLLFAVACSSSEESSDGAAPASTDNATTDNTTTDNSTSGGSTSGGSTSDTTAPSSVSVSINNGDVATNSSVVTLTLSATDSVGVTHYYASETSTAPSATATGWASYSTSVSFSLSSGSGNKTVSVWYKDAARNISAASSDSIFRSNKLPDTGQTANLVGSVGDGEDSDYLINAPSYTDNGDGTTTDDNTGLMWQQQDDGSTYNYANAETYCSSLSLAGHNDWRLPNEVELQSIVDYGKTTAPMIDELAFPNTQSSIYRASTNDANDTVFAWVVHFYYGTLYTSFKAGRTYYVRCVR